MQKLKKNNFLFIIGISIITLILLIVGAVSLYEDTSLSFSGDGYIISTTTTQENAKYYFSANTKYTRNVDNDVTFKDSDSNDVVVNPASFVHYLDGSVGYLQRGALVNLSEINSSLINYYNVNENNLISYKNGNYSFTINGDNVDVNAFIGRISDDKYIIAGSNLYLQVPNKTDQIKGDYFEVLFIEGGVVKIDNQEASYQVTAQDSYIYIGDNVVINLGNQKIYYDGQAKMLLSQITINGDENIDLDEIDSNGSGGGTGDGSGSGGGTGDGTGESDASDDEAVVDGEGEDGEEAGDGTGEGGDGTGDGSGSGSGDGTGDGTGDGSGGGSGGTVVTDDAPKVELIKAEVLSTVIDLSLQLNNASAIVGTLRASLTNISNGEKVYEQDIPGVNGTFRLRKESLSPGTEYALIVYEVGSTTEKRYFQKTFKTKDLGVTLERQYATSDSLSYNVLFNENTDVTKVRVRIYDSNGSNENIDVNEAIIYAGDLFNGIVFSGLESNSSYSVSIDAVWIDNAAYSDVYNINRIDNTLKKTPTLSGLEVTTNSEEVKFNIKLNSIKDPDEAITAFTYYFYLADSITAEEGEPEPVYSVVKNDADSLEINLNKITEMKAGVDYRCKIVAQYDDNEMIREVSTDYSANFLIRSKPTISFEQSAVNVSQVSGTLTLIDANCTVPVAGRTCLNASNNFILRYYKSGENETSANDTSISFDGTSLSTKISISELSSDTTYVFKVFGNYYDDAGNLHSNVQLGDSFYIKTDDSETLKFKVIGDNLSGYDKNGNENSANVVTFDAVLQSPQDEAHKVESTDVSSITLNLYNGSYNKSDNLIGTYVITDSSEIEDFFSNYTITNSLFTHTTIGKLDSLLKMIKATNNSIGTLNGTYTVEVAKVLYPDGRTKYDVEDNLYTFKLTPEYYLDSRIDSNPSYDYINVTKIKKEDLSEEEYEDLSKNISNLDELNDDTYVGIIIENSLSDTFVDSAFTYENVNVKYIITNLVTNKVVKEIVVDMDNKYQPNELVVYLEDISKDGGKNFTRGYDYKVSYQLEFETEDGRDPVYTNDALEKTLVYNSKLDTSLYRQAPIYSIYISTSNENSVTYRYKISDIDNALYDKKLYYVVGSGNQTAVSEELIIDNEYHNITVPIDEVSNYSIGFNEKISSGKSTYKKVNESLFESEYNYDNSQSFTIINDYDNTLKIRLVDNDITNRAAAYKVSIKATDDSSLGTYTKYFLASQLLTEDVDTGQVDEEGNPITESFKYIGVDYAYISDYMKHDLTVSVDCYYDSGLVGINQKFPNGLILENKVKGRYLNINNSSSSDSLDAKLNGMYMIKGDYALDSTNVRIYNQLVYTSDYNPLVGVSDISSSSSTDNLGVDYELAFTSEGVTFNNRGVLNAKVLKVANLKTNNSSYRFNNITPRVSLNTNDSTINSLSLKVNCSGVYGQFIKDSKVHNKFYLEIYSDQELTDKLTTLESDITITDDGVEAETVTYENLVPDTTYYVAIYAYVEGKYTRLYDAGSPKTYVVKTYEAKTLGAAGVLKKITYSVNPDSYNYDEKNKKAYPSTKQLKWELRFNSTKNFKVRFELYDVDGNAVNFDGSSAVSCNKNSIGESSNGYVNGCYVQIDKDIISNIKYDSTTYSYKLGGSYNFDGDNFVFGGKYYKLIVYAIPYTNGSYDYDHELILYQNDSLSTTGDQVPSGAVSYNITIPVLSEATFKLNNYSSVCDDNSGCSITFIPSVSDSGKVIKGGKFSISLNYENNTIKTVELDAMTIGSNYVTFDNLSSATEYEIQFSYEASLNNNGYTDEQKNYTAYVFNSVYTAAQGNISLGSVKAQSNGSQGITLSYTNAYNLSSNVASIDYTIRVSGGTGGQVSGVIDIKGGDTGFYQKSDGVLKLDLDLTKSSNSSFTLSTGTTYNIYVSYKLSDGSILGGKSYSVKLEL